MRVLQMNEVDEVGGGADGCYYNGQLYSAGAAVSIGNGQYQTCMSGGNGNYYWSEPYLVTG